MHGRIVSNFRLFLFMVFSGVIVVSCGGGGGNNDLPQTDTTKPTVTITPESPPAGQTVLVATQITATFSKSMNSATVIAGFSVVPNPSNKGTVSYDDSTKIATYNPNTGNGLQGDTDYTVTLRTSIKDKANNPLAEEVIRSFRTEDNVQPNVISTIPNAASPPISINDVIRIEFSEQMDWASFEKMFDSTSRNFVIATGSTIITDSTVDKAIFSGTLTPTGTFVEYRPANPFISDTTYTVTINTGVTDKNNNTLDKLLSFTFSTKVYKDELRPIVKNVTPTNGSKNNALNSVITVQFVNSDGTPEDMNWDTITNTSSVDTSSFIVKNESGIRVMGTLSNNQKDTLTFKPGTSANPATLKNLNLLDTYTITLKNTIKDKAGNSLFTNNNANNKLKYSFHTSDGKLGSKTTLGIGLGNLYEESNTVYLSTKKDGTVYAIWPKNNTTVTKKLIMSKTYHPVNGWDLNPIDITSKIVIPAFDAIAHSLEHISAIVTDNNDNHMLIWRDKIDNNNIPREYTSIFVSKWSKVVGGTETWTAPEVIHKGSATQTLDSMGAAKAAVHRAVNGTVSVSWVELDKTLTTLDFFLAMKQLKSNDGTFGTVWSPKNRITSSVTSTRGNLTEVGASLNSDSVGNIVVLYTENLFLRPSNTVESRLMVAKYPFPSKAANIFQLDINSFGLTSASSGDNFVFGWNGGKNIKVSGYNPNQDVAPSKPHIVSNSILNIRFKRKGVAAFPSGERLVVSFDVNGIYYAQYDPTISGWKSTQTLEPITATFFKFYHGARNIVTVAWEANSKIHIKRFKPGFGWQPTQSVTANNVQNIDITSSLDGKTTIIWESVIADYINLPTKSDLFAIRLE